jgi:hypothetical protein
MAKKKATRGNNQAVGAAWKKVRGALSQAETALGKLIKANRELVQALRRAGASPANARRQFDALAKRLAELLAKGKKSKAAARPARKARRK